MDSLFPRVLDLSRCLVLLLALLVIPAMAWSQSPPASQAVQGAAAEALLTQAESTAVPAHWTRARDLTEANHAFLEWQRDTLRDSSRLTPELRELARRKTVVPPLPPSASPDHTHQLHLTVPRFLDPDGRFGKQVILSAEAPTVSFTLGAESKLLSVVGASYKAGVAYATGANDWAFTDSAEVQSGLDFGKAEFSGSYQFFSSSWQPAEGSDPGGKPFTGQISAQILMVKGLLGYNSNGELTIGGSYDLLKTPKPLARFFEAGLTANLEVSAPVKVRVAATGGTFKHPVVDSAYTQRVARLLSQPVPCPYCSAEGQLHCPGCSDSRSITCPDCRGNKRVTCPRCEGSKRLYCGSCDHTGERACFSCSGSGKRRCSTCGGSGNTTYYETVSKPYQELVISSLGFDEAGQPVYERHYETRYRDEQVPHSQTCPSCSGSGDGGSCPSCEGGGRVTCSTCGGSGTLTCTRCDGDGTVGCWKCSASGRVTCPTCGGRPTQCPQCRGKRRIGQG